MKRLLIVGLTLFFMFSIQSSASSINIKVNSYQEVVKKDKKGKITKKWLKTTKVVPGSIIKYIDTITNDTNETINNAKIANPIDKNLIYIKNSAKSKSKFSIKFSVDRGKTYNEPSKLFVKLKNGKKRLATPKDYTSVIFNVNEIPAKSEVKIEYKVKIK